MQAIGQTILIHKLTRGRALKYAFSPFKEQEIR